METAKAICLKTYNEADCEGNVDRFIKGKVYTVVVKYYDKRYFKILINE
jgi:hypothetical protein